jgi:hypothetical protein
VGPGSSADAWELGRSSVVFFDLLLIQKLLKTDVNLEQLLRCPTCGSAGSSNAPLVPDGPAKLRRVCGPDHTYYIHSSNHVSCLEATDANAAGRVSASWMHAAHLRSSGPMPPADDRFELYASHVLSAALGSISTRHFADGSPAAQALRRCGFRACWTTLPCKLPRLCSVHRRRPGHSSGRQLQLPAASPQPMLPQHTLPKLPAVRDSTRHCTRSSLVPSSRQLQPRCPACQPPGRSTVHCSSCRCHRQMQQPLQHSLQLCHPQLRRVQASQAMPACQLPLQLRPPHVSQIRVAPAWPKRVLGF